MTTDLEKDSALKTNLSFNPLLVLITSQFRFINVSIYAGITIVSFWMTYLDYTFTYQLRGVFLNSAYQMLVKNGHHFRIFNDLRLGWPIVNQQTLFWKRWKCCITEHFAFSIRIFKTLFRIKGSIFDNSIIFTSVLQFFHLNLPIHFSPQLCRRLYVCSTVVEIIIVFVHLFASKFSVLKN